MNGSISQKKKKRDNTKTNFSYFYFLQKQYNKKKKKNVTKIPKISSIPIVSIDIKLFFIFFLDKIISFIEKGIFLMMYINTGGEHNILKRY